MSNTSSVKKPAPKKPATPKKLRQFTFHAPARREAPEKIKAQYELLSTIPHLDILVNAMVDFVLILNSCRQIVYASNNVAALAGASDLSAALGLRPGEALGCAQASVCSGGCGTSRACRECGAVDAILSGLSGDGKITECRMTLTRGKRHVAMDLRVKSTPFEYAGEKFVIISLSDISHEKRRMQLENVFLHDLVRDAFSLDNQVRRYRKELVERRGEDALNPLYGQVARLIEKILAQHDLAEAENEALVATYTRLKSYSFLLAVKADHEPRAAEADVRVEVDPLSCGELFYSDRALLQRVMGNLLLNAIEASGRGDVVTMSARIEGETLRFSVHNKDMLPESVRLQVFNRSYSTKSSSRGLGAYTARLLTETYLCGTVQFSSSKKNGTTFFVEIPVKPSPIAEPYDTAEMPE